MGRKRQVNRPDDDVKVVVLIDPSVRELPGFGNGIEEALRERFADAGQLRVCYESCGQEDGRASSVRWMTRVGGTEPKWRIEKPRLLFEPCGSFWEKARSSSTPGQLLDSLSIDVAKGRRRRFKVMVYDDGGRCWDGVGPERRRMEAASAEELVVGCQVAHGVEVVTGCKPADCVLAAVRCSKSVVEAIGSKPLVASWYPKKVGPPVSVTRNASRLGLLLLWRKHLMQISKRIGIEQAKVITSSDPDFSSPKNCIETYERSGGEGERLLEGKRMAGAVAGLGLNTSIGPEASRKVHKMMTARDGSDYL